VTLRLLECIAALAPQVEDEEFRQALRQQVEIIHAAAGGRSWSEPDLQDLAQRHETALQALRGGAQSVEASSGVLP
jgi:uncharacterized membrane protein